MVLVFVIVFCAIIALGFGAASAWSDFSRLQIPNLYAACVGAAFIPAFLALSIFAPDAFVFGSWKSHLGAGLVVFAITYALFHFNLIGGGDSKLLSVYALWVGFGGLMTLLFTMAVAGGVLGLVTLALKKWKPVKKTIKGSWFAKAQSGQEDVPYGIAIFVGALMAFWHSGYIQPETILSLATLNTGS